MKTIITSALILLAFAFVSKVSASRVFSGSYHNIAVADTLYFTQDNPKSDIPRMNAESNNKFISTHKLLSDSPVSESKNNSNHLGSGINVVSGEKKFVHRTKSVY